MKFKYVIVDDEPYARKLIYSHTSKIEGLELVAECSNAIEANNYLQKHAIDLLFLDIQMPEMTGLQLMDTLRRPPAVIITTAHRDFAPEAFTIDAIDYLLKPIAFERLLKAVNKFFNSRQSQASPVSLADEFIYVKADRKMNKILVSDILYVESLDDYVKIHQLNSVLIVKENISQLEEKLSKYLFVRIHRSFLVSSKVIKSISSEGVEVGNKVLPFGRAFKNGAMALLGIEKP
ncbi:MAG: response regulator transcription factor [Cytophagales bacterium]|nr:response regulator transcription factor [Cytophagales bacterium]